MSMEEIGRRTNLSRASVHSYIPYSKTVYKLLERSTDAERTVLYRNRQNMVQDLRGEWKYRVICEEAINGKYSIQCKRKD